MRTLRHPGIAVILLLILALSALPADLVWAQSPTQPIVGVKVNGQLISPGLDYADVMAIMGPPDQIRAMRGKENAGDYVNFHYGSYGLSIDISNEKNDIQGILVEDNRNALQGVPFKLGDNYQTAYQVWGKPDQTYGPDGSAAPQWVCYWHRGVYLQVGDQGRITIIFLVMPGKFDNEPGSTAYRG